MCVADTALYRCAGAKKEEAPKSDESESKDEKKPEPKNEDKPTKSEPKKEQTQVEQKAPQEETRKDVKSSSKPSPEAIKQTSGSRNETRVKMSRMRQRISERLKESQNAAASLTTFNEIDMSSLMSMRAAYKDKILKDKGVKLGFMSAFAKASAIALKEIPAANASIEGDQIVYRDYVDLSVAVATSKGLVTPVLRNAEGMSFLDIETGIVELGKKARDNKLTLEDMAGGSFTISNGGVFGSLYGTPIINTPQAAVLGMHAIKDKAVVVDGKIVIRPIMVVALTYDHRLLDGREAVTFLVRIKELIEDPRLFKSVCAPPPPFCMFSFADLVVCSAVQPRLRSGGQQAGRIGGLEDGSGLNASLNLCDTIGYDKSRVRE